MNTVGAVVQLFERNGHSEYGGEAVSQLEHALQAAQLAEQEQAPAALIAAALLHDFGHLLHDLPVDAPEAGVDDHHETAAANSLDKLFPAAVVEPIRLHVAAKRYLCATDRDYLAQLSQPSLVSLQLQGGPMDSQQAATFAEHPFAEDAVRLRRWDDLAKISGKPTPPLSYYAPILHQVSLESART